MWLEVSSASVKLRRMLTNIAGDMPLLMGGTYRRKKTHKAIKDFYRKNKTKRRTKDLDQVHDDLKVYDVSKKLEDPDLPGMGNFPCVECSRYFIDQAHLDTHLRTKLHKKRLKLLKETPYTLEEAERAAGMTK